ncbi:uncharacterized protein TNCV_3740861 [Trichonephila clavipes]|nr:uncharacterized protein TNCV_3740861 [Trichonephila clavipes]
MRSKTCLSLSASFDFWPLLCFEDVVLPSFLYAVIMADTVLLVNLKMFIASVTDAPVKRTPTIIRLCNSDRSHISTYHRQFDRRMQRRILTEGTVQADAKLLWQKALFGQMPNFSDPTIQTLEVEPLFITSDSPFLLIYGTLSRCFAQPEPTNAVDFGD